MADLTIRLVLGLAGGLMGAVHRCIRRPWQRAVA